VGAEHPPYMLLLRLRDEPASFLRFETVVKW